jgi:hypothetical protein
LSNCAEACTPSCRLKAAVLEFKLKPDSYPASYCDIAASDGGSDESSLRRAALSDARRSSASRRILRPAGILTWHRDMQLRQRAGTRNSSSRGKSSARKREFRKLADLQYGQFIYSRKFWDCTSNITGWRRGGKRSLKKNIGQNLPESLQLFVKLASFFPSWPGWRACASPFAGGIYRHFAPARGARSTPFLVLPEEFSLVRFPLLLSASIRVLAGEKRLIGVEHGGQSRAAAHRRRGRRGQHGGNLTQFGARVADYG